MPKSIDQRCLFITSTRLGDAVLSTGLLHALHLRHPNAKITVVCGALPASIFETVPYVDKVVVLKKTKGQKHWIDLWKIMWKTRWTAIVDLRNSLFTRIVRAKERYLLADRQDTTTHKVVRFQRLMKLPDPPVPVLYATPNDFIPDGAPVLALSPAANWIGKTWPIENFIELTRRLLAGPLSGWRVAVFAAGNERGQVQPLLDAFPDAIDLVGKGNPIEVASALKDCDLFIGNDSGLMHMAAAVGIKTLGLFGPSRDAVYGPWGGHVLRTPESYDDLIGAPGYDHKTCGTLMESLGVEAAYDAALKAI